MAADLILMKFDTTYGAEQALAAVRALEELDYAWIEDVAVVERHKSGRLSTHTTHGSVTAGAAWGWLTGGLIGLLFGPVGFLTGIVVGTGGGALIEKAAKESGLDKDLLDELRNSLDKGTSVLALIGASGDADQMARAFEPYAPVEVIRRELPEEALTNLKTRLEQDQPADHAG